MPVEELCESSGHWIWTRDVGARWLLDETAGAGSSWSLSEPEHWFKIREDGKWVIKVVTSATHTGGEEEVLDVDGTPQEGVTLLGGEEVTGHTRTYVEGNRLVIEWQGRRSRGTPVHLKNSKEVIEGFYYSTVEDLVRNVKGTRIFKRYPWYRIDNKCAEVATLQTFFASDVLHVLPSRARDVAPGTVYVDASGSDQQQEQAVFILPDGRECLADLHAFETFTLTPDLFRLVSFFTIENLTGELLTLSTYFLSDSLYIVPAMTVEVAPGTSHVLASSREVEEEQAVFSLLDGRTCKGITLKAFSVTTLKPENFAQYPFYKIENNTQEIITLTTYSPGDFMYIVPSMIVDISPGVSLVNASSGTVMEEQASFALADNKTFSGFNICAFQTLVLKKEFFK